VSRGAVTAVPSRWVIHGAGICADEMEGFTEQDYAVVGQWKGCDTC